jgi:hypothetical protein
MFHRTQEERVVDLTQNPAEIAELQKRLAELRALVAQGMSGKERRAMDKARKRQFKADHRRRREQGKALNRYELGMSGAVGVSCGMAGSAIVYNRDLGRGQQRGLGSAHGRMYRYSEHVMVGV